jgi:hypothetical protein
VLSGVEKLASHASKFTESTGHISGRITTESIGAYADMATHIGGRAGETTRAAVLVPRVDLNQQPCASDRISWLFRTVSSRCSGCRGGSLLHDCYMVDRWPCLICRMGTVCNSAGVEGVGHVVVQVKGCF